MTLRPGLNTVTLATKSGPVGKYDLNQLSISVLDRPLRLLSGNKTSNKNASFCVTSENPSVFLDYEKITASKELLAGVEQEIVLAVYTGSHNIEEVRKGTDSLQIYMGTSAGIVISQDQQQ